MLKPVATQSETLDDRGPLQLELTCSIDKALLKILRRFVCDVAAEMGFEEDEICKIEMAVDEACTNVAIHAYAPGSQLRKRPSIDLKIRMEPETLTILVQDHGKGSREEDLLGAGSLAEYRKMNRDQYRGLGTLIMKEFMDEVQFLSDSQGGTLVTLRKNLRK